MPPEWVRKADRGASYFGVPGTGHYSGGEDKKDAIDSADTQLGNLAGASANRWNISADKRAGAYGGARQTLGAYAPPTYLQGMAGRQTNQQNRFQNAPKGPSYVKDFYTGSSLGPGMNDSIYGQRKTNGYGQNLVKQEIQNNPYYSGRSRTSVLQKDVANRPGFTASKDRFYGKRNGADTLDSEYERQRIANNQPSAISRWSTATDPAQFTRGTDAFGRRLGNTVVDQNTANFAETLGGENSDSSRLNRELQGPFTSEASKRQQLISGGGGDSGKFLQGLDKSNLGVSSGKLAAEGPTYEEEFYTSQRDGKNSQFQMLQDDMGERMQREAAARGQFVSGNALELAMKGQARLGAEEFARRGDLAASAGNARRARLGQELEGAQALEGLRGSTSLARDQMGNSLSESADATNLGRLNTRAGVVGRREQLLGDLARDRDASGLAKLGMEGENSRFGDSQRLGFSKTQLDAATSEEQLRNARNSGLTGLASAISGRDEHRQDSMDDLANQVDQTRQADDRFGLDAARGADDVERQGYNDYIARLGTVQNFDYDQNKEMDSLGLDQARLGLQGAQGASAEDLANENAIDSRARGADSSELAVKSAASEEARTNFSTKFEAALQMGNVDSAIEAARNAAVDGIINSTTMTQIQNGLVRAGINAEVAASIGKEIRETGERAAQAYYTGGASEKLRALKPPEGAKK